MAIPRVFVSSTCMDFQETRRQLRQFIQEHGFDPVMSEFNDIFYDFSAHVQDACKSEIERCNLFILIVGNQYGTIYYKETSTKQFPDSVTLQEFKKAVEVQIPKHIFIDKFVKHDYDNYTRARAEKYTSYFEKHEVEEDQVETVRQKLRHEFDAKYPFPEHQYKYVFYFLDIIHELPTGNAIITFETFEDIKESLTKQWAGLMYEALEKSTTLAVSDLISLDKKIDRIEKYLNELVTTKRPEASGGKITFDISKLTTDVEFDNLEELKRRIERTINALVTTGAPLYETRGHFHKKPTLKWVKGWLESLPNILKKYKWSTTISYQDLFLRNGMPGDWYPRWKEIPYRSVFELNQIYKTLDHEGQEAFLNTLIKKIEAFVTEPPGPADDIPF